MRQTHCPSFLSSLLREAADKVTAGPRAAASRPLREDGSPRPRKPRPREDSADEPIEDASLASHRPVANFAD